MRVRVYACGTYTDGVGGGWIMAAVQMLLPKKRKLSENIMQYRMRSLFPPLPPPLPPSLCSIPFYFSSFNFSLSLSFPSHLSTSLCLPPLIFLHLSVSSPLIFLHLSPYLEAVCYQRSKRWPNIVSISVRPFPVP